MDPGHTVLAAPRRVAVMFVGDHLPIKGPPYPSFDTPRRPADNVLGIGIAQAICRRTLTSLGGKRRSASTGLRSLSKHCNALKL